MASETIRVRERILERRSTRVSFRCTEEVSSTADSNAVFDLLSEFTIDSFLLNAHTIVFVPPSQRLELPTN